MAASTHIPFSLPEDGIPTKAIVKHIVGTFRPEWSNIDSELLSLSYTTSHSDAHCVVEWPINFDSSKSSAISKVFIKFHNVSQGGIEAFKHLLSSKGAEAELCYRFGQSGYGPRMVGFFELEDGQKGRVDEFIESHSLQPEDLQDEEIRADVAKAHAVLHTLEVPGLLVKPVDLYYEAVINGLRKYHKMDKLKDLARRGGSNMDELVNYDFASRLQQVADRLKSTGAQKGWCIHDVQYMNVLVKRHTKQGESQIALIDFEFVFRNYRAFDIGGHFMQKLFKWFDDESKVVIDCRPYTEEEKRHFCEVYARQWNEVTGDSDTGELVYNEAELGHLAALTFDIHNMLLFMDQENIDDPLDTAGLNKLFEEFVYQYTKLGLGN